MPRPDMMPDARPAGRPPAWKRPLLLVLGWIFVVLGVAGLFLPFLQGILFLLIGVYLLAMGSARARLLRQRGRRWLGVRYPNQIARVEAAERQAIDWIRMRTARFRRDKGKKR